MNNVNYYGLLFLISICISACDMPDNNRPYHYEHTRFNKENSGAYGNQSEWDDFFSKFKSGSNYGNRYRNGNGYESGYRNWDDFSGQSNSSRFNKDNSGAYGNQSEWDDFFSKFKSGSNYGNQSGWDDFFSKFNSGSNYGSGYGNGKGYDSKYSSENNNWQYQQPLYISDITKAYQTFEAEVGTISSEDKSNKKVMRRHYINLSRKYHPDKNNGESKYQEKMKEITNAWQMIKNEMHWS